MEPMQLIDTLASYAFLRDTSFLKKSHNKLNSSFDKSEFLYGKKNNLNRVINNYEIDANSALISSDLINNNNNNIKNPEVENCNIQFSIINNNNNSLMKLCRCQLLPPKCSTNYLSALLTQPKQFFEKDNELSEEYFRKVISNSELFIKHNGVYNPDAKRIKISSEQSPIKPLDLSTSKSFDKQSKPIDPKKLCISRLNVSKKTVESLIKNGCSKTNGNSQESLNSFNFQYSESSSVSSNSSNSTTPSNELVAVILPNGLCVNVPDPLGAQCNSISTPFIENGNYNFIPNKNGNNSSIAKHPFNNNQIEDLLFLNSKNGCDSLNDNSLIDEALGTHYMIFDWLLKSRQLIHHPSCVDEECKLLIKFLGLNGLDNNARADLFHVSWPWLLPMYVAEEGGVELFDRFSWSLRAKRHVSGSQTLSNSINAMDSITIKLAQNFNDLRRVIGRLNRAGFSHHEYDHLKLSLAVSVHGLQTGSISGLKCSSEMMLESNPRLRFDLSLLRALIEIVQTSGVVLRDIFCTNIEPMVHTFIEAFSAISPVKQNHSKQINNYEFLTNVNNDNNNNHQ